VGEKNDALVRGNIGIRRRNEDLGNTIQSRAFSENIRQSEVEAARVGAAGRAVKVMDEKNQTSSI